MHNVLLKTLPYPLPTLHAAMTTIVKTAAAVTIMIVANATLAQSAMADADKEAVKQANSLKSQRDIYRQAKRAFAKKEVKHYQALKAQLSHYPLTPYLEYAELNQYLYTRQFHAATSRSKAIHKRIDAFINTHGNSYLGNALLSKWLKHLATNKKWHDYKRYYQSHVKKTELKCFYLQAQLNTNNAFNSEAQKDAFTQQTEALWLHPKSQPKACDPVFAAWSQKGYLTQDLLWQRHALAVQKKGYSLAHYLQNKMDATTRYLAEFYEQFHKNPEKIKNVKQLSQFANSKQNSTNTAESSSLQKVTEIVYNGLYRYAYQQPLDTFLLYQRLEKTYPFNAEKTHKLQTRIAINLIRKDEIDKASELIQLIPDAHQEKSLERLLRRYLREQQWDKLYVWSQSLPNSMQETDRWQYWTARAKDELNNHDKRNDGDSSESIYTALSSSRSFYGFLAADKQQSRYAFEDKPSPVNVEMINRVSQLPDFQRAKELFLSEDMYRARSEWSYGIKKLTKEEHIAAAQLAHTWGWNRKAIEAMAGAKSWDDLSIRFPIVHQDIIHQKAKDNKIPSSLIFSIARQESAWEFDAKSRVGASGLMQIMPATAKQTAKKANMRYNQKKLVDPEYNIALGSHYISGLLKQYNNHRPLAIASYNAGPTRVKRWLANTQNSLPLDVWIETIPFQETRKYVQNVLSYEVIYNHRQGQASSLLTRHEIDLAL